MSSAIDAGYSPQSDSALTRRWRASTTSSDLSPDTISVESMQVSSATHVRQSSNICVLSIVLTLCHLNKIRRKVFKWCGHIIEVLSFIVYTKGGHPRGQPPLFYNLRLIYKKISHISRANRHSRPTHIAARSYHFIGSGAGAAGAVVSSRRSATRVVVSARSLDLAVVSTRSRHLTSCLSLYIYKVSPLLYIYMLSRRLTLSRSWATWLTLSRSCATWLTLSLCSTTCRQGEHAVSTNSNIIMYLIIARSSRQSMGSLSPQTRGGRVRSRPDI